LFSITESEERFSTFDAVMVKCWLLTVSYVLLTHRVDMRSLFLAWRECRACCHLSAGQHPIFYGRRLAA